MKRLTLILGLFFTTITLSNAQFELGAGASLILDGTTFGVQGKALYGLSEKIDASGTFSYFLDSGGLYTIDLDAHYNLMTIGSNIELNPFAGLQMAGGFGDTDMNINVGAHFRIPVGDNLLFYAEPKWVIGGSDLIISAGLMF